MDRAEREAKQKITVEIFRKIKCGQHEHSNKARDFGVNGSVLYTKMTFFIQTLSRHYTLPLNCAKDATVYCHRLFPAAVK